MNATIIEDAPAGKAAATSGRTNRGSLDSLTIRRRTTGAEAAARAAMMRRLRVALPTIALILVAVFFLTTRKGGGDEAFLEDFADVNATTQNLSSAKPQFSGVDSRGNPYEITAESASQTPDNKDLVKLDRPRAVTAGGKDDSVVEAAAGVFDTEAKTLLLRDGVTLEHEIGRDNYVLRSATATVSIDDQTVKTGNGVVGEGPRGSTLKADRMQANNRDGVVIFEGGVTMRLYPKENAGETPPQAENGEKDE